MKRISIWAKNNKWPARIIIIAGLIILNALGIVTGLLLRDTQIILPSAALLFFVSLYAAGVLLYPRKKSAHSGSLFYRRQKTCDMLLVGSTFLMIVYLGNHPRLFQNYSLPFASAMAAPVSIPKDSAARTYKSGKDFAASMKDEKGKLFKWKERKKMLKEQIRSIKQSKDLSPGAKTAFIILSVIIALGLIGLLGALSCSISCGGSEALAIVVLLAGSALIVVLLVHVIRRIMGKTKKQIKNPETEPPGN